MSTNVSKTCTKMYIILDMKNINKILTKTHLMEQVIDYYLKPIEQFFSHIMARTNYISMI